MISEKTLQHYRSILDGIKADGLWKDERLIVTPQGADIEVQAADGKSTVLNFCANNYLGLSSHPEVIAAAHQAIDARGYGLSSVRFICGTQDIHRALEKKLADFFGYEDSILFSSCFDANGGVFEGLLSPEDAIISDALNHASIIDGIRLCKAERYRYANGDMEELEKHLQATQGKRLRMIATDGVFSMDGYIAKLERICDLAEKYDALVMVDDSHSSGFLGKTGRGTAEHCGVMGRVDVLTSTLGKALGGAAGGFVAGKQEFISLLRQRARPYLFSNTVSPSVVGASLAVLDLLGRTTELRDRLADNAAYFRKAMVEAGFQIKEGTTPIVPVMLGDSRLAMDMARDMLAEGIYVVGFYYPVVPKGQARIRVQLSAAHTREHLDRAIAAFVKVGKKHGVIR